MARNSRRNERKRSPQPAQEKVEPPLPAAGAGGSPRTAIVVVVLVALVFAVYAQVRSHQFINYDDPDYVTNNPRVLAGLTWSGIEWSFTHVYTANWHPLTWISHMIDVQLFDRNAGAHLLVSVTLHAINTILIFLFLRMATAAPWRSAAVAALFAVHPLHVESVAWVAERKDTLSALFFLLCLLAYTGYVLRGSRRAYAASVAALALGLMAKPMLVTTPFVLLLLDFWPFRRLDLATAGRRVLEKIPFALCIVPSILATLFAQRIAMPTITAVPLLARLANAAISYVKYVGKTFWPSNLSIMYPFPTRIDPRAAIVCGLLVMAVTVAVWLVRDESPWLFTGWCWFAGMLVPVIGIVQVGIQAMADRYTYLPQIGLLMAVVWTASDLGQRLSMPPWLLPAVTSVAVVVLAVVAWIQVGYWAGTIPLFEHALAATSPANRLAHVNLGAGLLDAGEYEAAEREYRLAEGFKPAESVYVGLALALWKQGKLNAAADAARRALEANPRSADAASALGSVELARGNNEAAAKALERSLQIQNNPAVAANLALARGQLDVARTQLELALADKPRDADLHSALGATLAKLGEDQKAAAEYEAALDLNPKLYDARMDYGALLSRVGRDDEAARQFLEAGRIRPASPEPHVYLALLEANRRHFGAAISEIEAAVRIDHDASNRLLINAIRIPARPTAIDEYLAFLRQQSAAR